LRRYGHSKLSKMAAKVQRAEILGLLLHLGIIAS